MAEVNPKAFPLADSALTNSILDLVQQVSRIYTYSLVLS
jgi:U4/U6 small nuclear ribonucleoprotein SNU13